MWIDVSFRQREHDDSRTRKVIAIGTFVMVRPGRQLSDEEKKEIIDYLHTHPKDKKVVPTLMEKYNCSETNIMKLIVEEQWDKWWREKHAK